MMVEKWFMAVMASVGLFMFLWPSAFVKPPYAKDRATSVANRRAIGLGCLVMGVIGFFGFGAR